MSINRQAKIWTRRQTIGVMTGLAGSLLLHSCNQKTQNSSSSSSNSETITAILGNTTWIGFAPLYVASEKGFFDENGLKIEYKDFSSAADGMSAFAAGRMDGQGVVSSEVVSMTAQGIKCQIVMVSDYSAGADGILARNSVKSIADFKGKEVAVQEGTISHFFLLQALKDEGLTSSDIKITNVSPDAAAAAYQAGRADIAVTFAPFLQKANEGQKDGRIIFDSSKTPGAIVDVYLFGDKFIQEKPKAIAAFIQGVLKARKFMESNSDEALAIAAKKLQLKPEEVAAQLKTIELVDLPTNLEMLSNKQSKLYLLNQMNDLSEFLVQQKQIPKVPDLAGVLEPKFIKEAQA
jgi:NitT/TauT family transport system substrate-binding protein